MSFVFIAMLYSVCSLILIFNCNDSGASTKRHAYWAMANCGGSADRLRELLLNIVQHYQVLMSYTHLILL